MAVRVPDLTSLEGGPRALHALGAAPPADSATGHVPSTAPMPDSPVILRAWQGRILRGKLPRGTIEVFLPRPSVFVGFVDGYLSASLAGRDVGGPRRFVESRHARTGS